jgi:hypothetical protein
MQLAIAKHTGEVEQCEIDYRKGVLCDITFQASFCESVVFSGDNLFSALCSLREYLELDGWYLLCNGARLNAYPSGMSLQMSRGRKVYLLEMGRQSRRDSLIDIFGAAELAEVATVAEQRLFFEQWLKSL